MNNSFIDIIYLQWRYLFEYTQGKIVSICESSSLGMKESAYECVQVREGTIQMPDARENVDIYVNSPKFYISIRKRSNPLQDKTPNVVSEGNEIFDSIDTIQCSRKISKLLYDKTLNIVGE